MTSHAHKTTRLESYFTHVADAIFVTQLDGRIIDANPAACALLGYANAQMMQMRPWDFVTSASRTEILDTIQNLQRGKSAGVQRTYRRSDGEELVLDLRLTRFQNDETANAHSDSVERDLVIVSCRDVTARCLAEKALRAAEELARGQMQALTRTLDAMAQESAPDRFVEHVLSTILHQLDALNISVWQRMDGNCLEGFEYSREQARRKAHPDRPVQITLTPEDSPHWQEICLTGKCVVCEDVAQAIHLPHRERLIAQGVVTVLLVPLLISGEVAGMIGVRFDHRRTFRDEELELAQALAHQATLAMQLTRLSQQSRQAAIAAERNRFARDMHDTLAQSFTGVIVQLEAAQDAAAKGLKQDAENHFQYAREMARTGLGEARRSVMSLRPQTLNENDLGAALQHVFEYSTRGTGLQAVLTTEGNARPLPPHYDEHLLHIGCEALTNALRHARATQFAAQLCFKNDTLSFHLRDNGGGFDTTKPREGLGLRGIGERVAEMRGTLTVESTPTTGTAICVVLPLPDNFGNLHDEHFA